MPSNVTLTLTYTQSNSFLTSLKNSAYIGFATAPPSRTTQLASNVAEPEDTGYQRTKMQDYMSTPDGGEMHNTEVIFLADITAVASTPKDWTYFCLFSAKTGGNLLAFAEMSTPITVSTNSVPLLRENQLTIIQ